RRALDQRQTRQCRPGGPAAPIERRPPRSPADQGDDTMQKIVPCLWFDDQAEEAARFYTSIFRNSRVGKIARYGEGGPRPKGTVLTVKFRLDGQEFLALNGGAQFKFPEAVSFIGTCETPEGG